MKRQIIIIATIVTFAPHTRTTNMAKGIHGKAMKEAETGKTTLIDAMVKTDEPIKQKAAN